MSEKIIKLASDYTIPAVDYAGQGNAILGIRDSGKTYTGTKAAEGLLDAGIPIIVYDPIGIWKNLKIGVGKHKGYPIVVAGGEGSDIRLTPTNAVEIVRAAMKENVSLVIDLYSPELINKSTWIRIVQETVDELMYQNKNYGLRHIFLEEAAEFIPQRLQYKGCVIHHSPNEGKRGPVLMYKMKHMGVSSGFPDLVIFYRGKQIAIELKAGVNKPTDNQNAWLQILNDYNIPAACCTGFDQAANFIDKHFKPLKTKTA